MIEQSIYFALGCIVTALLALAFAPLFWSRALRLTRKRLQLQVPLSMQEILAERDQLRAGFAVERLRLEQAMDRIRETKAGDMAEVGRLTVQAAQHTEAVADLRRMEAAQAREIERLQREAAEAVAEVGALNKALNDAHAASERHRRYAEWADDEHVRLRQEVAGHAKAIEVAEARAADLQARLDASEGAAAERNGRVEDGLRSRLETAMRHAARHEASGISSRRELDESRMMIRAMEEELSTLRSALEDAREREKGLHLQRSLQVEKVRGTDRAVSDRLELLQAENAALQEALAEAQQPGATRASEPSTDGDLRASIHALGLAVASMMHKEQVGATQANAPEAQGIMEASPRGGAGSTEDALAAHVEAR